MSVILWSEQTKVNEYIYMHTHTAVSALVLFNLEQEVYRRSDLIIFKSLCTFLQHYPSPELGFEQEFLTVCKQSEEKCLFIVYLAERKLICNSGIWLIVNNNSKVAALFFSHEAEWYFRQMIWQYKVILCTEEIML